MQPGQSSYCRKAGLKEWYISTNPRVISDKIAYSPTGTYSRYSSSKVFKVIFSGFYINTFPSSMRVLHILDHSIPLHSGYTFRTLSILKEQRNIGWETFHLTGTKQENGQENCTVLEEDVGAWHFYRTPISQGVAARLPVLNQVAAM